MFRPARMPRDPKYALGDPGHVYIPDLTQTYLGPLAKVLGIHGDYAGLTGRTNLYKGLTPFTAAPLLTGGVPKHYRPVIGGNFHATKTLDIWLSSLPEVERKRAEMLFIECCKEVVEKRILPDMERRTGHAGAGAREKVKAMAVLFQHSTNAAGHYHFHVLVEIHNAGKTPNGEIRALAGDVLFANQGRYSLEVEARVMLAFHKKHNLVLRPNDRGSLEVDGVKADKIPTLRQTQITQALAQLGLSPTPKNRDRAARHNRQPRDPGLTVAAAAAGTRTWFRARGVDGRRAVLIPFPPTSRLAEDKKAEVAVTRALVKAQRLAARFSFKSLHTVALREALHLRADPDRVAARMSAIARSSDERERYGMRLLPNGLVTTAKIEQAHDRLFEAARQLGKNGLVMSGGGERPATDLRSMLAGFAASGSRVHVVAGPATRAELGDATGKRPELPEAFAARLSGTPNKDVFLKALRRPTREAAEAAPELALGRDDVVVLDVRRTATRAAAHIAETAARVGATVVIIGRIDPSLPDQTRAQERGIEPS